MGMYILYGWSFLLMQYVCLVALLIAASEIDRRHGILPNTLIFFGTLIGLLLHLCVRDPAWSEALCAMLVSVAGMMGLRFIGQCIWGKPGMGMGDVKLAAMMTLFLGWNTLWVFFWAIILGGLLGLVGLWCGRLKRSTKMPFAPFVAVSTGFYLFQLPFDLFHVIR